MDEEQIEKKIQNKGLGAPRLTPNMIDSVIKDKTFTNLPSGKCVICEITLQNGYTVYGESACVSPSNFDQEIGNEVAFKNAREKVWQLEGYLLQEKLARLHNSWLTIKEAIAFQETNSAMGNTMKMKFKDAPTGARFKFIGDYSQGDVYVKLSWDGIIVKWEGNTKGHKPCWIDEKYGYNFDTLINVIE